MSRDIVRVLLVEDSATEAKRLMETAKRTRRLDPRLTWVERLEQALALLAKESFDLVLLDLMLPDASGLDGVQAVRRAAPQVPIVVWTSMDDEESALQALEEGVQDYLAKDQLQPALLERTIRYAIVRHRLGLALERSNRDLAEFAQTVSHDLKAPLRAISHMARFIEEDLKDHLTSQTQDYLERLQDRIRWLNQMINGLLAFAQAGASSEPPEEIQPEDVVVHVRDLLQIPAGIRVEMGGPMPTVHAQRVLLHEVFQNLIGNAAKHRTNPMGRIRIGAQDRGSLVEFFVEDDGPGIPSERRGNLFQPFKPGTPGPENSGMGLALVRKIVERQGGKIRYEPSPLGGSRFVFTWPKLDVAKVVA